MILHRWDGEKMCKTRLWSGDLSLCTRMYRSYKSSPNFKLRIKTNSASLTICQRKKSDIFLCCTKG